MSINAMTQVDGIRGHVFAGVWDAVEDSPAEAANMRLRSEFLSATQHASAEWDATEAARRLDVAQPRLDDLIQGRIATFSLDALTTLAARAGLNVRAQIDQAAA